MKFLVLGGAGYVGSHFVRFAENAGHHCVVYDNLCRGHRAALSKNAEFVEGDILDVQRLSATLRSTKPDAILHYAAYALVGESVAEPLKYYQNNVQGVVTMVQAMVDNASFVPVVFSSSCAVYGTPKALPIDEQVATNPQSPYGRSKLFAESVISDAAAAWGFPALALRYFNACGADEQGDLGEDHHPETHLIPNAIKAGLEGKRLHIYGNDFATRDGTCVRDYIHVTDLAEAHLLACQKLREPTWQSGLTKLNLGSGHGFTNLEIVKEVGEVLGRPVDYEFAPRRAGDPAQLFADNRKAVELLGFTPSRSDLNQIIASAARWHRGHPRGYAS